MSERVTKCTSWLGHKFEARYSKGPSDISSYTEYEGAAMALIELAEKSRKVTYEGDICVRCGLVVDRKTPEKSTEPTT